MDSVHQELSPGYMERMLALAARRIDDEAMMRVAHRTKGGMSYVCHEPSGP